MSISSRRQSKGLTQQRLADELRINRSTVAMWEAGESFPRADKLPQLARILGCTISDLFEDNEKAASNG